MRVAPIAAVSFAVVAAGCGAHDGAPNVKGKPFPAALAGLRAHGYLVAVPFFPRPVGSLEGYRVIAQRTSGRRTVTLKVAEAPSRVVIALRATTPPPPLPRLVGMTYRNAQRAARRSAAWLRVSRVEPLRAAASADGIDAFVIASQRREAFDTVVVRLGERPCWKSVINDWFSDGAFDGVYPRRCYREALREIPGDLPYSELAKLLRRRLR
jgi:hypothetical protein